MAAVVFEPDEMDEFGPMSADDDANDFQPSPYGSSGASLQQTEAKLMGGAVRIVANSPRSRALGFGATSALPPVLYVDTSEIGI